MFGTRADLVIDLTLATNALAPVVAFTSIRLARRRSHDIHRLLQIGLLSVCVLAVLVLEVRIRLGGGSGALVAGAPREWLGVARGVLAAHITGAVLTYLAWAWLAIASSRRYKAGLPGGFSRTHRRVGWLVFAGLCFTTVSATAVYMLAFVA